MSEISPVFCLHRLWFKMVFQRPKNHKITQIFRNLYSLIEHTSTVQLIYMEWDYVSSIIGSEFKWCHTYMCDSIIESLNFLKRNSN